MNISNTLSNFKNFTFFPVLCSVTVFPLYLYFPYNLLQYPGATCVTKIAGSNSNMREENSLSMNKWKTF